jgi:hypothetical protein
MSEPAAAIRPISSESNPERVLPPCGPASPFAAKRWSRAHGALSLLLLLLLVPGSLLLGGDAPTSTATPAENWVLNLFTDLDGFRSMTFRGATVRPAADGSIAVTDLNVTVFSGDASARVETIILSEDAVFQPKANNVNGTKNVRVIRDELEVTGSDWSYEHAGKKVSISKNVRVVYRAPLKIPL